MTSVRLVVILPVRLKATWVAACFGLTAALCGQELKVPTLEEILRRQDANLGRYDARVPNLFCEERVHSQVQPGPSTDDTVTDSIFRLKRSANADHTTSLEESREVLKVDGKAATSQDLAGPSLLSGVFEGGLAVVSLSQAACMNYSLQKVKKKRQAERFEVRFATALTARNSAACLLQEKSTGRALIDPSTMQVLRLELKTPHHEIIPGSMSGRRDLAVDYAPVVLGGETFWLPSDISMNVIHGSGTFHVTEWSFDAAYRNYTSCRLPRIWFRQRGRFTACFDAWFDCAWRGNVPLALFRSVATGFRDGVSPPVGEWGLWQI